MRLKQNEGKADRIIRAILGIALIVIAYSLTGIWQIVAYFVAAILLITAATGFCGLYSLIGIKTNKK